MIFSLLVPVFQVLHLSLALGASYFPDFGNFFSDFFPHLPGMPRFKSSVFILPQLNKKLLLFFAPLSIPSARFCRIFSGLARILSISGHWRCCNRGRWSWQTAGSWLYESGMALMLKGRQNRRRWRKRILGELLQLGIIILMAFPEILPWPVPVVLIVRIICVTFPKNGKI